MLEESQAYLKKTLRETVEAHQLVRPLLEHPNAWTTWLKRARQAQLCLLGTVVFCAWVAPPLLRSMFEFVLPSKTKSSGFFGMNKTTVSHPWVEPLATGASVLLWLFGLGCTLVLLYRALPETLRFFRLRADALGDTLPPPHLSDETSAPGATSEPGGTRGPFFETTPDSGEKSGIAAPSQVDEGAKAEADLCLAGRYRLEDKLGEGGMGQVFLAQDVVLERKVALKRLPSELMESEAFKERFRREARALARLNDPHVVHIFDFLEIPEGERLFGMWMVMEVISGGDLEMRLEEGRLDLPLSCRLARQMALALNAAHSEGIVHRDFKPANVMLTAALDVKVTDFGIAQLDTAQCRDTKLTHAGAVMGTPTYMSPEQARGENVTPASDVYSLGATLYEMFTGQLLFEGTLTQVLAAHILTPPPPFAQRGIDGFPERLEALVLRMLAKEPSERPALREAIFVLEEAERQAA